MRRSRVMRFLSVLSLSILLGLFWGMVADLIALRIGLPVYGHQFATAANVSGLTAIISGAISFVVLTAITSDSR